MEGVIDKIKKLLRMKRGGTQAEIATALRLAQEIAAKHGINLDTVNPDDDERTRAIGHDDVRTPVRTAYEQELAYCVIRGWFDVHAIFRTDYDVRFRKACVLTIIGDESARQIGTYVYTFLVRAFRRAWRERVNRRLRDRRAFLFGMYAGIVSQLPDLKIQTDAGREGIVLSRKAYLDRLCPNRKQNPINHGAYSGMAAMAGHIEGLKTMIRPGVNGAESGEQLLSGRLALHD